MSNLLANLFFATVDGLYVGRLLDSGTLEVATGSPVPVVQGDASAHDVTTVGNFVYASDEVRSLYGFRFDPATETLIPVQSALELDSFTVQPLLTSDESGVVYARGQEMLYSYLVDQTTGELTLGTSTGADGSALPANLVYEPDGNGFGYLFDVDFNGNAYENNQYRVTSLTLTPNSTS